MARTVNVVERAARRDAILDAAQRLILSNGYERLTIQDILEELQISKGAFYHYFDSKPAVVEALTERLVDDSERVLAQIAGSPASHREAATLLRRDRPLGNPSGRTPLWWRCCRSGTHPTTSARLLVDCATAARLAPLLSAIVRQGVDEHRFATAYPEHAGSIIVAVVQALQDAIAQQLLTGTASQRSGHGAHIEAIERYLGVPAGTLYRGDARAATVDRGITTRRSGWQIP